MKNKTLLAVDIGNTNITFGAIQSGCVKESWVISGSLKGQYLNKKIRAISSQIKKKKYALAGIIICSVVPRCLREVKTALLKCFKINPIVTGISKKVPIRNLYRNPKQVGQDRLVCSYAAKIIYGTPAIIIDFGTAITFDIISKRGDYCGGIIVPGMRLSAESLFKKTALLPKVKIEKPTELIGKDTKNSILSGLFYGYGALCDGLISLISNGFKKRPRVIVTGGYSRAVSRFIKAKHIIDEDLILKGLSLLEDRG